MNTLSTNNVISYLFNAEIRWVIVKKNHAPLTDKEGNVKVYDTIDELMKDYDKKSGQSIMTEIAFINLMLEECNSPLDYITFISKN